MSKKRQNISGPKSAGVTGDTHRVQFDPSEADQPSTALVECLAAVKDADPIALEPLHNHLDPDALNRLFDATKDSSTTVTVSIDGYAFRIEGTGTVVVDSRTE